MHKLVLFCKSYIGDVSRLKILKQSIDKFNVDKIPFYICVPRADLYELEKKIKTGLEDYELTFVTDEQLLELTEDHEQNWFSQQIIKLSLHKLNVSNFYVSLDSDCYFIKEFCFNDFMYDEKTPYTVVERDKTFKSETNPHHIVKKYFNRQGIAFNWGPMPIIMSSYVLEQLELYLKENNTDIKQLLKITPFEFQWYGEFYFKTKPFELIPLDGLFKSFNFQTEYNDARKRNSVDDYIRKKYIGINMQAGWVKEKIYKPSMFIGLYKLVDSIVWLIYARKPDNFNLLKLIEVFFRKFVRDPIRKRLGRNNAK